MSSNNAVDSAVDALANAQRIYDFYFDVFSRKGVKNPESDLMIVVDADLYYGENYKNNAAMLSNAKGMIIGNSADKLVFSKDDPTFSAYLDRMGHEWAHGIMSAESPSIDTSDKKVAQLQYVKG